MLDTLNAVIARSIALHPSFFADECDKAARIHRDFALITYDRVARDTAAGMASQLCEFADQLRAGVTAVPETFDTLIMTAEIARRLQCLPREAVAMSAATPASRATH
jgi:hypothetical protein